MAQDWDVHCPYCGRKIYLNDVWAALGRKHVCPRCRHELWLITDSSGHGDVWFQFVPYDEEDREAYWKAGADG